MTAGVVTAPSAGPRRIELGGKVALVTGASRGIGAATARRLASAGAVVVLLARNAAEVRAVAAEIVAAGGGAEAVVGDVSSYSDVETAARRCVERHGAIDILINNAGVIDPIARITDSDPAAWGRVADINYKGVYHGLRAVLPTMVAQRSGTVVNISSGAATSPLEGWSHYCSSKAATLMLTRCADQEYREAGVVVVGLSPGTVATEVQVKIRASGVNPVSKLDPSAHIPPEWAAEAAAWLCAGNGAAYAGADFSIKTDEGRRLVGLI